MTDRKYFFILSGLNGMAMDIYYGGTTPGTKITTYYKRDTDNDNQLWYVDMDTSTIRSKATSLCLTINGSNRLVIDNHDSSNAKQILEICGTIIRQRSEPGQVLEVLDGNISHGAEITMNDFNQEPKQFWTTENVEASPPEGRRAPSVWLRQNDNNTKGDILMIDGMVPNYGLAVNTYYSMLNWNAGQEGGGYLGIQDHPDGKNFIFSIWDSKVSSDPVEAVFTGPGTEVEPFGGEGTGLKSWNFLIGWETDQWQTFVTRSWQVMQKTHFGFWVGQQYLNKWHHLVTMKYPVEAVLFNPSTTGSFVEDWIGNGDLYRTASYKNPYKRGSTARNWIAMRESTFTAVLEDATSQHNKEYAGGLLNPMQLYLGTGGNTSPAPGLDPDGTLFNVAMDDSPGLPVIDFNITSAAGNTITWSVPESSTPQFGFSVRNETTGEVLLGINPEARSAVMDLPTGSSVELTLEDILGRTKTATTIVTR